MYVCCEIPEMPAKILYCIIFEKVYLLNRYFMYFSIKKNNNRIIDE